MLMTVIYLLNIIRLIVFVGMLSFTNLSFIQFKNGDVYTNSVT